MEFNIINFNKALVEFYERVKKDDVLGPLFLRNVTNWDSHLKKIETFWENHLVSPGLYKGNPLLVHQKLHVKDPFNEEMFDRWLSLFEETMKEF